MKKALVMVVMGLLLTGCTVQKDLETVRDDGLVYQNADSFQLHISLPEDASLASMATENASICYCDDYSVVMQKLPGGDVERTITELTGMSPDRLTVIKLESDGKQVYRFSWSAMGEEALENCSCMLLDDGQYHHAVTMMADYRKSSDLHNEWQSIFDSVKLINTD